MLKFSAARFSRISAALRAFDIIIEKWADDPDLKHLREDAAKYLTAQMDLMKAEFEKIGLRQSAKCAERTKIDFVVGQSVVPIQHALKGLFSLIESEIEDALFFWVPTHRADYYGKRADILIGGQWCSRFQSTIPEIEEASKCYAVGRFTAAAFHLMRATESGTKALGLAIGLTPAHPGWKLVFEEVYAQYKRHKPRHTVWNTHEAALVRISGDLRTISHVWRNDLAHFVDTYGEEDAREMFVIVPVFMRNLAAMIDETGTLY